MGRTFKREKIMKTDNIYTRPIFPVISDIVDVTYLNADEEKERSSAHVVNVDHFAVLGNKVVDPSVDGVTHSIVILTAIDSDNNPHSNIGIVNESNNEISWTEEWFGDRM